METSARVRGNNEFFILKIENSAGAELGRSWSGVEVELATLPAQSSSFLDFLKMYSSAKAPDVAGAERSWSPAPAPSSETLLKITEWIYLFQLSKIIVRVSIISKR